MARLINQDDAIEKIIKIVSEDGTDPTEKIGQIIITISNEPVIDIVQCKDCMAYGGMECPLQAPLPFYCTTGTDFCSMGKRREGNEKR